MNPKTLRSFVYLGTALILVAMLTLSVASSSRAQLDPTAQQQTVDAVVFGYFTQTAQAQQAAAVTQTVQAAPEQALTATANFNATVDARMRALQRTSVASTLAAGGITTVTSNREWTPLEQDFGGMRMVFVPPGCFRMGSDPQVDADALPEEQPQREVCLTQGYWIDQTEVTNAAYGQFIDAGGYTSPAHWTAAGWQWKLTNNISGPEDYAGFTDPQQPRVGVSWYEAEAYARWRGCRLPTEAEWEYAARGPDSLIYPWGNTFVEANLVYGENDGGSTAAVGPTVRREGASWVGALDMSGNAWEWVADWYQADYYQSGPRENPPGPKDGEGRVSNAGEGRVARGGSWGIRQNNARAAYRDPRLPGDRYILGLRVVCAAPVSQ